MQVLKASYLVSSPDVAGCPAPDRPEFAFIGRSNVGKSSLINMLCRQQNLAKTSASPGKTQLINHFEISSRPHPQAKQTQRWYLVDLPGYGYAKVSQRDRRRWEQMIENYLRKRENLVNIFVLIDARHDPQPIDLAFINKLGEWQLPFAIVFTKADKVKPNALTRNVEAFGRKLLEHWEELPLYFVSSSEKGTGRDEVLAFIQQSIDQAS